MYVWEQRDLLPEFLTGVRKNDLRPCKDNDIIKEHAHDGRVSGQKDLTF